MRTVSGLMTLFVLAAMAAPATAQSAGAPDTLAAGDTLAVQDTAPAQELAPERPRSTVSRAGEPRLVFEREVFRYAGRARRDPFQPLTGRNAGPLFADLVLRMIIFSDDPSQSVVTVSDASNNQYRLRRGDTVGNATVVDIGPSRVVFSVNDFGLRRQAILDLKANREGA
jgi:hypothetical protein